MPLNATLGASGWEVTLENTGGVSQEATKWRLGSAIAARKAGLRTRPPIIMGIGDSNFTGEGAGTGGTALLNGGFAASPMQKILSHLTELGGLPLRNTAFFGEGNSGNNAIPVGLYDTRITLGTGWDRDASTGPIGGRFIDGQIGSGFLTVNFGSPLDTVEVHYPTNTTLSAALGVYASDDTLIGTINQSGALGISSQQFTSSKFADGIVKFKNDGAALALISGCICWLSTEKAVIVCQGTWSAATAATYAATTNPWTGLGHMSRIQPDCTIVALTINDINAGTVAATYGTNLATVLAVPALWGDVIVATGAPCNATNWTANSTWRTLEREAIKAGALYGAPFVSMHNEFGSWATANAQGYFYNNLHMSAAGYSKQAQIFARVLSRMAT